MKQRTLFLGLVIAGSLALTGCTAGGTAANTPSSDTGVGGTPAQGGTVFVLQNADFSHLDPAQGFDGGVNNFYRLIYRTLTTQGAGEGAEGTEIVPDLAVSLGEHNEDATVWTYTLKDDIFFEDGTPITSKDVKFGVERSLDPSISIGSPYAKIVLDIPEGYEGYYTSGPLDSIETPDDKTIVFHLNQPYADFDAVVGQAPFTPFPADAGVTATSIDQQPIASGPYRVTEYERGSTLVLERNEHWDADTDEVRTAAPDSFEWTFGLDGATIDERMIAGQGDDRNAIAGSVQASSIARIQTPEIQARTVQGLQGCTTYMAMNTTKPGMDNPLVRQAINVAMDKQAVKDATGGSQLADIATTILPPTVVGRQDFDLYGTDDQTGDPAKAKEMLAEAGYPDGFSFVLDIRNQPKMQAQAEAVQQALAKAGITVEFNLIDTSTYYEVIGTLSQQHDAAITGWCPDWPTGATFLPPLFEGSQIFEKGNSNIAQLNDPAVNERMAEIRLMTDVDEANAAWGALDEQIMELAPQVPMLYEKTVMVLGSNIAGAYSHAGFSGGTDYVSIGLKSVE
ncbi:ABC transporter substrate-binding protein [Agromyces intestinalis]|uniref:ABC transporter substrate-binding protein n=1 Tax=Agromyces intestinalis TaxID=2592652 RepID=A0A5C1YID6_9MICO|nr:ABC transporter substrate-binding protein [Agromyces intestinalis]QEO14807.1 ABC transporter substrate-binding protein [Agromyces intestinalis]